MNQRSRPEADRRDRAENQRRAYERQRDRPSGQGNGQAPRDLNPAWRQDVGRPQRAEGGPTFRLFIAVKLPEAAIEEIATFINGMPTMAGQNVRWTPRENVHLTLLFLGDTPTELVPQIQEHIAEAASNSSPFHLRLGETGAFPAFHSPKILWVGLDGEVRKLVQLQGRVEGAMRSIGFEPEKRAFSPHITVGRTVRDLDRQYAGDVGFSWRRSKLPAERAQVPVSEVKLVRSRLQDGGAIYEDVFTAELGG